jgi:predicted nucleic acid-binding protein
VAKTKPMTVVISDAGPLIALSRIDKLVLLQQIFQQITITTTIQDDIFENDRCKGKGEIIRAINAGWIKIKSVDIKDWKTINTGVDVGEASAIYLARQASDSTLLIIDDQAGRAEAKYQKITIIGTAAVIGIAKMQGYILSAKDVLHALREAGYYIGDAIIETVLQDIGE